MMSRRWRLTARTTKRKVACLGFTGMKLQSLPEWNASKQHSCFRRKKKSLEGKGIAAYENGMCEILIPRFCPKEKR